MGGPLTLQLQKLFLSDPHSAPSPQPTKLGLRTLILQLDPRLLEAI